MLLTNLITDLPHCLQSSRGKVKLFPCIGSDGIHHKVGVNMRGVDVSGYQHFTARKETFCQLQCDLVRFCWGNLLLRREGLDILVEEYPLGLTIQVFCCHEALECQIRCTVDSCEVTNAILVRNFLFLRHIPQDTVHSSDGLLSFADEATCCHGRSPGPFA